MFKYFLCKLILIFYFFTYTFVNANAQIVNEINVIGNNRISSDTIKIFSNVKIKDDLSKNDLNNILKSLYETNFFSDVNLLFDNSTLIITVSENPIIQNLIITGVEKKTLKNLLYSEIFLKNSSPYVEYFVKKDLDKLKDILQQVGFYFSSVTPSINKNINNTVDLIFDIDLGKKSFIGEISFLGDKKFKSAKLLNIIASEENKFWKIISNKKYLNKERINLDKRLLTAFYKNKGYYNVKIESNTINYSDNQNFQLSFNINSGNKYFFNDFKINLPEDYDPKYFDEILKNLKKSKGSFYSFKVIEKTLKEIEKIALNKSYEFVDATIDEVIKENDKLDIIVNLSESKKIYVEKINIYGNNITIEDVLRNQLVVDEGDGLNNILLKKSINNIRGLNIFKKVNYEVVDGSSPAQKVINLSVEEKPTGEISLGAGVGTTGASTAFGLRENNFLGKGITLNSNFSLSTETVRGQFSVTNPNFNNTDKSVSFSMESSETDKLKDYGYNNKKHGFSIGTRFEHFEDFFISPGIETYYESLETSSNASANLKKQKGSYLDTKFNYLLDYDQRDQAYQPTSGYRSRFNQQLPIITENVTIINGYEINSYYEYLENIVASVSFYAKASNSIGNKNVRISDRQFIPSRKLRGFEPGKVGPIDAGSYVGGNYVTSLNVTSELPILESMESANFSIFLDMANVWGVDYSSAIDASNKLRSSTGIGVDWITPIGPLSFSLSKPITKQKTDKTQGFRFNLGTTF